MSGAEYSEGVKKYIRMAQEWIEKDKRYIEKVKKLKFDTISVHGAYSVEEALERNQGSIIEPVFLSTSQAYRDSDEMEAGLAYMIPTWCYSRIHNPTVHFLERTIALLEGYGFNGDTTCLCTSSGMAAIYEAIDPFIAKKSKAADEPINLVATAQCYGGTFQQLSIRKMQERGIEVRWVKDPSVTANWSEMIDGNTRLLYGEMPSNPQQGCFDIEEVAKLAHKQEIPLIVDATVATAALMRPLIHGADIVVHSTTKSMTSSGCALGGAVISRKNITSRHLNSEQKEDFALWLKLWPHRDNGQCYSPLSAMYQLNDLRTLRSKMQLVSYNTMKVSEFLNSHPKIEKVDYLGLKDHRLHGLASKYMKLVDSDDGNGNSVNAYGHLMSFNIAGGAKETRKFFDGLQRIWRATDLGRIKSVATIPAISTHQQQGEEGRKLANVPMNLVRLCVGGEHPDDTIADLKQALDKL